MKQIAEVIQFQKKQEAKFICSRCGADRDCNCNAPAVEKLAAQREAQRRADAKYAKKRKEKRKQNQDPVDIDRHPNQGGPSRYQSDILCDSH